MKVWSSGFTLFPYSFDELCTIFWERYPNSFAGHIISEDVLSREVTRDTIVTRKLIVKQGNSILKRVPRWLSKMTEVRVVPTIEESVFDRSSNTLTTYTRNVSHVDLFEMHERCVYRPSSNCQEKSALPSSGILRSVFINVNTGRTSKYVYENVMLMGFQKSVAATLKGLTEKLEERYGMRHPETTLHHFSEKAQKLKEKVREGTKEKLRERAHLVGEKVNC